MASAELQAYAGRETDQDLFRVVCKGEFSDRVVYFGSLPCHPHLAK